MESISVHLHKSRDAEDSYALSLEGDPPGVWRFERGYGGQFQKIWTVELQSRRVPELRDVEWETVLERVIDAYDLNDPVVTDFEWPLRKAPC